MSANDETGWLGGDGTPGVDTEVVDTDFVVRVRSGDAATIAAIRRSLACWLATAHVSAERASDVLLACYEAMANVVEHAYRAGDDHEIGVHAWLFDHCLTVTVVDHGTWRPPARGVESRGRGIGLMTALSDTADIRRDPGGTRVQLGWDLVGDGNRPMSELTQPA